MAKFLPYARLALLAAVTSLTLTACFDRDKKCDPRPSTCQGASKTTKSGGNN